MGRPAGTEGELWSLGTCSNCFAPARAERSMHRQSVPPLCTHHPETHVCQCGWGLGREAQDSEIRSRGVKWGGLWRNLKMLESAAAPWGCRQKAWSTSQRLGITMWVGCKGRDGARHYSLFSFVSSPDVRCSLHELRSSCKATTAPRASEVVVSYHHCPPLCFRIGLPANDFILLNSLCIHGLPLFPLHVLGSCMNHHHCWEPPWLGTSSCIWIPFSRG